MFIYYYVYNFNIYKYMDIEQIGYFMTKIFHPNVSKHGEVCVNTLKKDWNKDFGIERILLVINNYYKIMITYYIDDLIYY